MGPYGPIWALMGAIWAHEGPIWAHMGFIWAHMGPYETIWAQVMGELSQQQYLTSDRDGSDSRNCGRSGGRSVH